MGAAWFLYVKRSVLFPGAVWLSLVVIAVLTSQTRHAWVMAACLVLAYGFRSKGVASVLQFILLAISLFFFYWVVSVQSVGEHQKHMSLEQQLIERSSETAEVGVTGSRSFHFRYVLGTERFLNHAVEDPTMLVFGQGTGFKFAAFEVWGRELYYERAQQTNMWGFVSNCWLLVWRNWGVLGFVALLWLHIYWFCGSSYEGKVIALLSALCFLYDNYALGCKEFFVLMTLAWSCLGVNELKRQSHRPALRAVESTSLRDRSENQERRARFRHAKQPLRGP